MYLFNDSQRFRAYAADIRAQNCPSARSFA